MLLQNDKPTLTLSRERATRILFDNEPMVAAFPGVSNHEVAVNLPETNRIFNNNHNLAEYNKLIENEYKDKISASDAHVSTENKSMPRFEQYYNETNPLPVYHAYKPKPLADFEEISNNAPVDEELMQKLYEAEIHDASMAVDQSVSADDTAFEESYLRLNAKGLIACISFIAVTALIIALVILNSIAIGNTGMEIKELKAANSELSAEYNIKLTDRQNAYDTSVREVIDETGLPPERVSLPRVNDYDGPSNSDYNTNLFDQICKFLTSLFG